MSRNVQIQSQTSTVDNKVNLSLPHALYANIFLDQKRFIYLRNYINLIRKISKLGLKAYEKAFPLHFLIILIPGEFEAWYNQIQKIENEGGDAGHLKFRKIFVTSPLTQKNINRINNLDFIEGLRVGIDYDELTHSPAPSPLVLADLNADRLIKFTAKNIKHLKILDIIDDNTEYLNVEIQLPPELTHFYYQRYYKYDVDETEDIQLGRRPPRLVYPDTIQKILYDVVLYNHVDHYALTFEEKSDYLMDLLEKKNLEYIHFDSIVFNLENLFEEENHITLLKLTNLINRLAYFNISIKVPKMWWKNHSYYFKNILYYLVHLIPSIKYISHDADATESYIFCIYSEDDYDKYDKRHSIHPFEFSIEKPDYKLVWEDNKPHHQWGASFS